MDEAGAAWRDLQRPSRAHLSPLAGRTPSMVMADRNRSAPPETRQ